MDVDARARLALADALQLHKEREEIAERRVRRLKEELEAAEVHLQLVRRARADFTAAVHPGQ